MASRRRSTGVARRRAATRGRRRPSAVNASEILSSMVTAARDALADAWPGVRDFAGPEIRRLAWALADITHLIEAGKVNPQQARALDRIHRNTAFTVLLTLEGLGVIAVENAINAALGAVGDVVNAAVGFRLM